MQSQLYARGIGCTSLVLGRTEQHGNRGTSFFLQFYETHWKDCSRRTIALSIFMRPAASLLAFNYFKIALLQNRPPCRQYNYFIYNLTVNTMYTDTFALKYWSTSPANMHNSPKSHFQDWFKSNVSTQIVNFQNIYPWIPECFHTPAGK